MTVCLPPAAPTSCERGHCSSRLPRGAVFDSSPPYPLPINDKAELTFLPVPSSVHLLGATRGADPLQPDPISQTRNPGAALLMSYHQASALAEPPTRGLHLLSSLLLHLKETVQFLPDLTMVLHTLTSLSGNSWFSICLFTLPS